MTYWTRQFRRADEETLRTYHLPQGCDYQGRHPEAAEACTEVGADDDDFGAFRGLLSWPCVSCAAIVCAALVAVFWPH